MLLFFGFLKNHSFAELFGVFFEFDFALHFSLIFARKVDFFGVLVYQSDELIL